MIDYKQKANAIVSMFWKAPQYNNEIIGTSSAKECAKIHVKGIIEAIDWHEFEVPNKEIEDWQQVLTEIENF